MPGTKVYIKEEYKKMKKIKKVVLAYSGGLDTSVAIKWLKENYCEEVIAVAVDVGQKSDLEYVKEKALKIGAIKSYIIDAKEEFVKDYVLPGLQAGAIYESSYPLATAYSRPLISKILVEVAEKEQAKAIVHGCTGKGNDQVRFEVSIAALNPQLQVIAPAREWGLTREEEIEYAKKHQIPVPVDVDNPYSVDQNLWGRSVGCGVLEDPQVEPPEEVYEWTVSPEKSPDKPTYLEIYFEKGVPQSIDEEKLSFREAHKLVGKIVLYCLEKKKHLEDLTLLELKSFHKNLDEKTLEILKLQSAVKAKDSYGGTSLKRVKESIQKAKKILEEE